MKSKYFILCVLISIAQMCNATNSKFVTDNYLSRPTGQYGVGFEDFHWMNENVCPDPNFNGKNQNDFSADNKNYCHEIMVRIYYPTAIQNKPSSPYYRPLIKFFQDHLRQIPTIPEDQIVKLNDVKSFSMQKAEIFRGKRFPVLLLSPGFGCPAQMYENFVTELVSHGYIVIGINTPFINVTELPNGHVVQPAHPSSNEIESIFVILQSRDLTYVFDKIHSLYRSSSLFSAMDLKQIGLFGHSIGARALADVVHAHPNLFQAAATLDIGFDSTGASLKNFDIPFMHEISSNRISDSADSTTFELGHNGYLVGLAPSEEDHNYSYHMNFSDYSTLKYLPALNGEQEYLRQHVMDGFSLTMLSHDPTEADTSHFDKAAYVLIKTDNNWNLAWYNGKEKIGQLPASSIKILDLALAALPNKAPEELSDTEIELIRNIIMTRHRATAEISGTGDGWELDNSIKNYLVKFFNTFLKHEEDSAFKNCKVLSKNTYIKCGP